MIEKYEREFAATATKLLRSPLVRLPYKKAISDWLQAVNDRLYDTEPEHNPDPPFARPATTKPITWAPAAGGGKVDITSSGPGASTVLSEHLYPNDETIRYQPPPRCKAFNPRGAGCVFDATHVGAHATSLGNSFTTT